MGKITEEGEIMACKNLGIIVICVLLLFPLNAYSSSIKEDNELQKKCEKESDEIFRENYGYDNVKVKTANGFDLYSHRTHYNKIFNICFQLVEKNLCREDGVVGTHIKELLDINEDKKYGSIMEFLNPTKVWECYVAQKKCKSAGEWDLLVKPYMEE
jgi:hypothetical protein